MEKSKLTADQLKKLLETPNKKGKKHAYKHKKATKMPAAVDPSTRRKMGKAKVILQKSPRSHLEQIHCTVNQSYPLFFLEKLQTKKIKSLEAKERLIALQNIRRLTHLMQQWINVQLHQDVKVCQDKPIEFYNLMEKREERHFSIDRIIKYLSEP